jgi:hypothetical protein
MVPLSKSGGLKNASWVRIPPSPPDINEKSTTNYIGADTRDCNGGVFNCGKTEKLVC